MVTLIWPVDSLMEIWRQVWRFPENFDCLAVSSRYKPIIPGAWETQLSIPAVHAKEIKEALVIKEAEANGLLEKPEDQRYEE